ncbi:hypothetical protein THRCLA_23476 [Thraustotheca clavata]|uniref:Uncharacterized protein n=1 Tax=Thraustotheca clavata TaxID=74557 RepID=A0A1V9Y457_9STRA|nr:hypothetical protein THRCLA_23476 [Thraustotheca clavata]
MLVTTFHCKADPKEEQEKQLSYHRLHGPIYKPNAPADKGVVHKTFVHGSIEIEETKGFMDKEF